MIIRNLRRIIVYLFFYILNVVKHMLLILIIDIYLFANLTEVIFCFSQRLFYDLLTPIIISILIFLKNYSGKNYENELA